MSESKETGLALLRTPFPPNQISKLCRPTKKDNPKGKCQVCGGWHGLPAIALDYVGHAALTDRLLEADPQWSWEPVAFGQDGLPAMDRNGGMWIRLTVCGVTRLGYGNADNKQGGDAVKEIIGDALRNAAMRFGAALDLWHKGDLHMDEDADDKAPAPAPKSPRPAAKPPAMSENELDACCTAIQESDDIDSLKGIFGGAYKRASKDQQGILKAAYEKRKNELQQPVKEAA